MDWNFQQRAGILDVKNFGVPGKGGRASPELRGQQNGYAEKSGGGSKPIFASASRNSWSTRRAPDDRARCCQRVVRGERQRQDGGGLSVFFVANTGDSTFYQASGVFGAGRVGPVNPNGSVDLQSGTFIRNYGPAGNIGLR